MDDATGIDFSVHELEQRARSVLMTQRETWLAALVTVMFSVPFGTLLGLIGLLVMRGSSTEIHGLRVASLRRRFRAAKWLTICAFILSAVLLALQLVGLLLFATTLGALSGRHY